IEGHVLPTGRKSVTGRFRYRHPQYRLKIMVVLDVEIVIKEILEGEASIFVLVVRNPVVPARNGASVRIHGVVYVIDTVKHQRGKFLAIVIVARIPETRTERQIVQYAHLHLSFAVE